MWVKGSVMNWAVLNNIDGILSGPWDVLSGKDKLEQRQFLLCRGDFQEMEKQCLSLQSCWSSKWYVWSLYLLHLSFNCSGCLLFGFCFMHYWELTTADPLSSSIHCSDIALDSHLFSSILQVKLHRAKTDWVSKGVDILDCYCLMSISAILHYLAVCPANNLATYLFPLSYLMAWLMASLMVSTSQCCLEVEWQECEKSHVAHPSLVTGCVIR